MGRTTLRLFDYNRPNRRTQTLKQQYTPGGAHLEVDPKLIIQQMPFTFLPFATANDSESGNQVLHYE